MTRKDQIIAAANEFIDTFHDRKSKEGRIAGAAFIAGAVWADANKRVIIPYEEIEQVAKEIIDKDWSKQQDRIWSMIERQHLYNFIQKAEKWFFKQLVSGNISTDKISMDSLVENFKHTMLQ